MVFQLRAIVSFLWLLSYLISWKFSTIWLYFCPRYQTAWSQNKLGKYLWICPKYSILLVPRSPDFPWIKDCPDVFILETVSRLKLSCICCVKWPFQFIFFPAQNRHAVKPCSCSLDLISFSSVFKYFSIPRVYLFFLIVEGYTTQCFGTQRYSWHAVPGIESKISCTRHSFYHLGHILLPPPLLDIDILDVMCTHIVFIFCIHSVYLYGVGSWTIPNSVVLRGTPYFRSYNWGLLATCWVKRSRCISRDPRSAACKPVT